MPRQRASAVIIQGSKILLVKVQVRGESWWCLPGGTIEPGETPEEAICRELREELNLHVRPQRRLYELLLPDEPGIDIGILADTPTGTPRLGIDPAVVEWAWRPLDQVDDCWQVDKVRKAISQCSIDKGGQDATIQEPKN
jgi:8-oxo-dGTP pyrophosphatase MutT (NUDIX family)